MRPQVSSISLTDLIASRDDVRHAGPACVFTVNGTDSTAVLSRSELHAKARVMAAALLSETTRGSRAIISLPTGPEFFTSFFACLFAGIVAVPVPSVRNAQALSRLEAIAAESGATLFLTSAQLRERVQALDPDFWPRTRMRPFIVDPAGNSAAFEFAGKAAGADEAAQWGRAMQEMPATAPNEPAYLQFTSGSTGTPRGVMISHANVLHNIDMIDAKAGRPRQGAAVSWLPLYHDMGLVSALFALSAGLRLVMLAPIHFLQDPWRWLRAISHHRAVYSGGPNFAYELCNRSELPAEPTLDLSSWQFAFCGAEMVRPATLRRFAKRMEPFGFRAQALSPAYGLAESTLIVTGVASADQAAVRKLDSASLSGGPVSPAPPEFRHRSIEISECGMPEPGTTVRVVDPAKLQALPDGHVGEVWVSGPSKALGYWQRPEETRAAFEARLDGDNSLYLRTGDLGFMDGGRLFLTGRIKELIIVRGRNFHPHEIEEAVRNAHPALTATAAAFSVTTEVDESLVVVCEVRRNRRNGSLQEVLMAIQGELVRRLDVKADVIGLLKPGAIPRTTSGKVQRLKCRERFASDQFHFLAVWPVPADAAAAEKQIAGGEAAAAPGSNGGGDSAAKPMRFVIENWIGEWLSYRLRIPVENIDPRQPFSDYGLDSLAAVQLSQAIEDWLEVPVPETLAWSYPTPEALSAYLEHALQEIPHEVTVAAEQRGKAFRSEVDLALQWVERLTEPEVEHLYRRRLVKE